MIRIEYTDKKYIRSYNAAVKTVCRERKYLSSTRGFSLTESSDLVHRIISRGYAQFLALENEKVVGWCDIIPRSQELFRHVGVLAVGVLPGYRGQGIGRQLILRTLEMARKNGLEKVELGVFSSNDRAIRLYHSLGFIEEGRRLNSVKLDQKYDDVIMMGRMLGEGRLPERDRSLRQK